MIDRIAQALRSRFSMRVVPLIVLLWLATGASGLAAADAAWRPAQLALFGLLLAHTAWSHRGELAETAQRIKRWFVAAGLASTHVHP